MFRQQQSMNEPRRRAAHQRADRAIRRQRQEETAEKKIDEWITEQNLMRIPLFPDTMHPELLKMEIQRDLELFQHHLRVAEDIRAARLQLEVNRHKHHLEMIRADQAALIEERYLRIRANITLVFLYSFAVIFALYALGYVILNPSSLVVLFDRIMEAYSEEF